MTRLLSFCKSLANGIGNTLKQWTRENDDQNTFRESLCGMEYVFASSKRALRELFTSVHTYVQNLQNESIDWEGKWVQVVILTICEYVAHIAAGTTFRP